MFWEELTSAEFKEAVIKAEQTCLVPLGVIEKHGDHLPLGTDLINIRALAGKTAAVEPVVIFPPLYFGQITEARHVPGTLSFDAQFLLNNLRAICDEIFRNGFKKIILLNGHGGNAHLLPFFAQMNLDFTKEYTVFVIEPTLSSLPEIENIIENKNGGHGDEAETSMMLGVRPDLVKLNQIDLTIGKPRKRLTHLSNIYTAIWWYADYPEHFAGDPLLANAEKGAKLLEIGANHLARMIRAIKNDTAVEELQREFFSRAENPLK